jgi:ribosome recycling factor
MINDILQDLNANFDKAFESLRRDLMRVRTGRANVHLLDGIRVNYYGQPTPLSQVANVQAPEARLITIKPWDTSVLKDIERAILGSDLNLNPANDGNMIRLSIPPLTEERRKDLVKQVRAYGEETKVAIRNHRRDANTMLKDGQKDGDITEDDLNKALKEVQTRTDAAIAKVDSIIGEKEKELLEV